MYLAHHSAFQSRDLQPLRQLSARACSKKDTGAPLRDPRQRGRAPLESQYAAKRSFAMMGIKKDFASYSIKRPLTYFVSGLRLKKNSYQAKAGWGFLIYRQNIRNKSIK
jgi:hypothetical protein